MNIQEQVRNFILETFYAPATLRDDASLLDTGIVDSTGVLELIGFVEERFGVTVDDHDIHPDNFDSIERIIAFVQRRQREDGEAVSAPPSAP